MRGVLVRSAGIVVAVAIPVAVALMLFSKEIARLLGGPAFEGAGALMVWLGPARTIQVMVPIAAAALGALGRPALSIRTNALTTLLALPLLPLLLRREGLAAAGPYALAQALLASVLICLVAYRAIGHARQGSRPPPTA